MYKPMQNNTSITTLALLMALFHGLCMANAKENQWPLRNGVWTERYTRTGETIGFEAYGNDRGIPVCAVFYRYRVQGKHLAFTYGCDPRKIILKIDEKPISLSDHFICYVNDVEGLPVRLELSTYVPEDKIMPIFQFGRAPSFERMVEFWDSYIVPAIAKEKDKLAIIEAYKRAKGATYGSIPGDIAVDREYENRRDRGLMAPPAQNAQRLR